MYKGGVKMENVLSIKNVNKYTVIRIDKELAAKIKSLGQGSYERNIKYLLGNSVDQKIIDKVKELEDRLGNLQNLIEKVVTTNKLRMY